MAEKYLHQKKILLGVTGSIAAYKAAELASKLTQAGALVDVILTPSALEFITPLTFQSVTGRPAFTDKALWGAEAHVLHVGLGHTADLFIVAPATANTIARLAGGLADNLLALAALSYGPGTPEKPLLVAPAMDVDMYNHPASQQNIELLRQRGAVIVGPESGHLASGLEGPGRMTEPSVLLGHARHLLTRGGPLQGKHVVVTAGGTQEPIDPVRLLTNRSSGKQGYALAQAALDAGAEVTLISTTAALDVPPGAKYLLQCSAADMQAAVLDIAPRADVLLMAAAVSDFKPARVAEHKIKKGSGVPSLDLEQTSDILQELSKSRQPSDRLKVVVGFAAETQDLLTNAATKLKSKNLDLIVANDVSKPGSGFAADNNQITLLFRDGHTESLPLQSKSQVAERVVAEVVKLLEK